MFAVYVIYASLSSSQQILLFKMKLVVFYETNEPKKTIGATTK